MDELEEALKEGKYTDPEGLNRELFKEEVMGNDLKRSMLTMFNKIKDTGIIPSFMRFMRLVNELESNRGIFIPPLGMWCTISSLYPPVVTRQHS